MSRQSPADEFSLGALVSVWVAGVFVVSCLAAAAPVVETLLSGLVVAVATYAGFQILCPVAGGLRLPRSARQGGEKSHSAALPGVRAAFRDENAAVCGVRSHVSPHRE